MKFRLLAPLMAALAATACSVPLGLSVDDSASDKGRGMKGNPARAATPFSFKVAPYRLMSTMSGIEPIKKNGRRADLTANQLVLELKDGAEIDAVLARAGVKLIERSSYKMPGERKADSSVVDTSRDPQEVIYTNRYIVSFTPDERESVDDLDALAKRAGLNGEFTFGRKSGALLLKKALKLSEAKDPDIEKVCLNPLLYTEMTTTEGRPLSAGGTLKSAPSSTFWNVGNSSWKGNNIINATSSNLADFGTGANIKVAVIDSDFSSTSYPTMTGQIVGYGKTYYTYDFVDNDAEIAVSSSGNYWHGRTVTSAIFAPVNDSAGNAGTAPGAIPLLQHCKGATANEISATRAASAVDQARSWGAHVINMSFGGPWDAFSPLGTPITNAYNENRVVVCSNGDGGDSYDHYPSALTTVISVSSHDNTGNEQYNANSLNYDIWAGGDGVAVGIAPGVTPTDGYQLMQGSSFSAAFVSGVVAVGRQRGTINNRNQAYDRLRTTAYTTYPCGYSMNAISAVL